MNACVLSLQLCLTICNPLDCSLPGASVHEVLQARILEWLAMPSSRGSSWPRDWTHVSCIGRQVLYYNTTWEALLIWYPGYVLVPPLFGIFCRIRPFLLILLLYSILWVCVALLFVSLVINGGSQGMTQTQTLSAWFSASRTEFVVFTEPVAIQANFAVDRQQTCIRFILFALIFSFFFIPRVCLWTCLLSCLPGGKPCPCASPSCQGGSWKMRFQLIFTSFCGVI